MLGFYSRSIFAKLLLYMTLSLSIFTILLSYILYATFEKRLLESVSLSGVNYLKQTSYNANYMNDNARNFALSVFNDPNTVALMYNDQPIGMSSLLLEMNRIQTFASMNSFVHSVYIYNKKMNHFYSNNQSLVDEREQFFDQEIAAMMERPNPELRLKPIRRVIENDKGFPRENHLFTYMIYENYSETAGVDGAVIVNIRSEYLQNLISSFNSTNALMKGDTFIIDREGGMVLDSTSNPAIAEDSAPLLQEIAAKTDRAGYFTAAVKGKKALVTYVQSDFLAWTFVHIEPYSEIVKDAEKIRAATFLIGIGLLVAGLFVSFLISNQIYSPIRNLVGRVKRVMGAPASGSQERLSELDFLNQAFAEAFRMTRSSLQSSRNDMLKRHLHNPSPLEEDHTEKLFARHQVPVRLGEGYLPIALRIDRYARFSSEYSAQDQELFRYSIGNVASEMLAIHGPVQIVDMEDGVLVAIVQAGADSGSDAGLRDMYKPLLAELQAWCGQHLRLSLTAAIGGRQAGPSRLHDSYMEAMNLLSYRLVFGHGSILAADALEERYETSYASSYRITSSEEQQLYDELVGGRTQEAVQVYRSMMDKVARHSYDAIMSNILYLLYFTHNTMSVMESNSIDKYQLHFHSYFEQLQQLETLDDVHAIFEEMFMRITDTVASRKNKRSSVLADSMQNYVQTHYADPGLCLDMIAQEMNMSKIYLGKLFRETFGQSVADYIVDVRVSKALELLHEENKTLSGILDEIGVENKKYFYTLFKKKMGVSFSDYRLKHVNMVAGEPDRE